MSRIIRNALTAPGGYWIDIEVPGAYTDGTSRIDRVFVAREDLRGRTLEERKQAILDALADDPLAGIAGREASAPTQTRAIFERRMESLYADWQRWKNTRLEAQARALGVASMNALTNREDAAWAAYAAAILQWRSAP
jgi:hypothetical protein